MSATREGRGPRPFAVPVLLVALVAAGCGSSPATKDTSAEPATSTLVPSTAEVSRNGPLPEFSEPLAIDNPYLAFGRRGTWRYEGTSDGEPISVEVAVTSDTKIVAWSDGQTEHVTETMVVRYRGWANEVIVEEALDYVAQGDDGGVWYFGEDVDNYVDGEIVDDRGTWLAGTDGALPALLMPAEPQVGQVFYSADVPDLDLVERDEILALDTEVETPDGAVTNGLLLGATQPDGAEEKKIYVPDLGEVLVRSDSGELRLIEWAPQGDGPDYKPAIDPARFTATVDNPQLPQPVGATWTHEVETAEGNVDILETIVLDETRMVAGVETNVVEVTLTVDDELEERTLSWYAQDDTGTVWLFGELDEGYEDGELIETSTWEAGVDGAKPGIAMVGSADSDTEYRVGYVAGVMEERGRLVATDSSTSTAAGDFNDVWVIENWSDLEPGVIENKHYAPGIGLVFADSPAADSDTIELIATSLQP